VKAREKRIYIVVTGGNVVGVYADKSLKPEVVVVDWDNIKCDSELSVDDVEQEFEAASKELQKFFLDMWANMMYSCASVSSFYMPYVVAVTLGRPIMC